MDVLAWTGRILFSLIFITSGVSHLRGKGVDYADAKDLPAPPLSVRFGGLIALLGGLSVLFWVYVDIGAILLLLFLLPAAFRFHDFWTRDDPMERQTQKAHFMKNLSMAGAALAFWVLYNGGGMPGL